MPKAMQYTKGSIIYFDTDLDERIFILQSGKTLGNLDRQIYLIFLDS